jgi:hypothetical protein
VRFRSKARPHGLLTGRDQRRMTLLVIGVGVLLIGFNTLGKPGFWNGIFPGDNQSSQTSSTGTSARTGLSGDEFLSGSAASKTGRAGDPAEWLDDRAAAEFEREQNAPDKSGSRIPRLMLNTIRDDVIGVHSFEADAYHVALRVAEKLTKKDRLAAETASYALFMDAPDSCRGKPWVIRGEIRKIQSVRSEANAFGVGSLIDAWLSTPDSGNQLIHVVASSADSRLAEAVAAGSPEIPAVVTGIFFKREGYRRSGEDGTGDIGLAPLVLGGRIEYFTAAVVVSSRAEELTPWLGWFAAAIGIGVVLVLWQFQLSDRGFRSTRTHQLTTLPARPTFASIEAISVHESLRQMEDQHSEQ